MMDSSVFRIMWNVSNGTSLHSKIENCFKALSGFAKGSFIFDCW